MITMATGTAAAFAIGLVVGTVLIVVAFLVYVPRMYAGGGLTAWLEGLTWFVCGAFLITFAFMLVFPG